MDLSSLNDDCLRFIFCNFTLTERIRLESVCKKWRHVMSYDDIRIVDFTAFNWSSESYISRRYYYRRWYFRFSTNHIIVRDCSLNNALDLISRRCGKFVNEFVFNERIVLDTATFERIVSSFPNVTRFVALTDCKISSDCLPMLLEFDHLESLELNDLILLNENGEIITLDEATVDLDSVKQCLSGTINSHQTIKEVILRFQRTWLMFMPQMQNPTQLTHLTLHGGGLVDEHLVSLTECNPKIVSLEIIGSSSLSDFGPIANLKHLNCICLGCHGGDVVNSILSFSDKNLEDICRNCSEISEFHLVSMSTVTDFAALSLLRNLSAVTIKSSYFNDAHLNGIIVHGKLKHVNLCSANISDNGLMNCQNLTTLYLNDIAISDDGVVAAIRNCSKLSYLHLCGTRVSSNVLRVVGASAKELRQLLVVRHNTCFREEDMHDLCELRESRIHIENLPLLEIIIDRTSYSGIPVAGRHFESFRESSYVKISSFEHEDDNSDEDEDLDFVEQNDDDDEEEYMDVLEEQLHDEEVEVL